MCRRGIFARKLPRACRTGNGQNGGGQYSVRSYVDSQNSFGAMIRTKWTATVTVQMNDKTIRLNDFQTE